MALESTIISCGASTWTQVFACIQIVYRTLYVIYMVTGIFIYKKSYARDKYVLAMVVIFGILLPILGIIMANILLDGTAQERVGYLRAWQIYGVASIATLAILIILKFIIIRTSPYDILTNITDIVINVLTFVVLYIHMKDINDGVFDLHPEVPVTV